MWVAVYKLKSTGKIQRRIHIGNHKKNMERPENYAHLISYEENNNWKRFKLKNRTIVAVNRFNNKILDIKGISNSVGFLRDDIFYNKVEQLFCFGNDINKALSMKKYTLKYARISCQLKRK